jgi:hypothetical protein
MPVADYIRKGRVQPPHFVRVRAANNSLNANLANNGILRYDTVDSDTDGYALGSLPLNQVTIPPGLGGVYIVTAESTTAATAVSTSIGMGLLINGVLQLSAGNQSVGGPGAISYTLAAAPTLIGHLYDGDIIQLYNTSTSTGPNSFTGVFLSLFRLSDHLP